MAPMFLLTLIGCLLFAVYGVLIAYYHRTWAAIPPFLPSGDAKVCRTTISVLVPARNEAANIAACMESLSRQSYPKALYQVIVIDDHSTDGTWEILRGLYYTDLSITCLRLSDGSHKKFAIETGVRVATGELIVTTDADCLFDPDWLSTLAAFYEEKGAKFIAAPVRIGEASGRGSGHFRGPRSFLSIFQTLDFITLQGITGAAVYKRFHSMCNGANLAYEKKAFDEVEGFKGIDSIPSGDDMLLMHKIYKRYPERVFFLKSTRAIVSTKPVSNWKGFIHQRVRWASKADRYDDKRIFWVLLLVYLVNVMFFVLAVAACWNSGWLGLLLIGLLAKTMLEYPFVRSVAAFFGQQSLMVYFPFLQPFHIVYTVIVGWMGKFSSYSWKDRKINK
jgi:cellulose synthase/poly-beta-1,6-N-acetylglucosamine synthase-like glycosyltransferase